MNNTFFKKIISLQVMLLIASFGFVQNALAGYGDIETSKGNSIGASSLDAEVTSESDGLQLVSVAQNMIGGNSVNRGGEIENVGKSDFLYNVKFVKVDGSDSLCKGLQLEAKKESNIVYNGDLSAFDYDSDVLNSGEGDDWEFIVTLPNNVSTDEDCNFDFEYTAWQTSFTSPNQGGWVDKEKLSNNKIHTGIETPVQTGYNEDNGDSYALPHAPDANELACIGDITNVNGISVHWIDVSNGNDNVKYQRQYKVGTGSWHGNEIYSNPYTNYRSFGSATGNDGVYGSRVRAWADTDNDNVIDVDEVTSEWSNECFVEFDGTAPAMPTGLQRLSTVDHGVVYECDDIITIQSVHPDWDDNTEDDFDHYEYTSFNAPNGAIGLNEKIFYESIFEYNGSWLPHDGTYGFAVRAVDKAGNKSEWALSGKNLDGSCKITYDSTAPTVEITSHDDGDSVSGEVDLRGTVKDVHPDHYWLVIENSAGKRVAGPGVVYDTTSFTDKSLLSWDTTLLPDGEYTIKLEARDALENKDNGSIKWIVVSVNNSDIVATVAKADDICDDCNEEKHDKRNMKGSVGDVVMNEFVPNPKGKDKAKMPNGEWIELYNNGDDEYDVEGWYFEDAGGNRLTISVSNSDNDDDTKDGGETIIKSGKYLVVYNNSGFSLNNDGDTIEFFDAEGKLMDSYKYKDANDFDAGKTYARFPDGIGPWVDPSPTPGGKNKFSDDELLIYQKIVLDDCFVDGKLTKNKKQPLCAPVFVKYIELIDDVDSTKLYMNSELKKYVKSQKVKKEDKKENDKQKDEEKEENKQNNDKKEDTPTKSQDDVDEKKQDEPKVDEISDTDKDIENDINKQNDEEKKQGNKPKENEVKKVEQEDVNKKDVDSDENEKVTNTPKEKKDEKKETKEKESDTKKKESDKKSDKEQDKQKEDCEEEKEVVEEKISDANKKDEEKNDSEEENIEL